MRVRYVDVEKCVLFLMHSPLKRTLDNCGGNLTILTNDFDAVMYSSKI